MLGGGGDPGKVLEQGESLLQVDGVVMGQFERDLHHVLRAQGHPGCAVGLVEVAAGRQRSASIEHPDIVQAKEAALEHVAAVRVLAVEPPHEVLHHLLKRVFKKRRSPMPVRAFSIS